MSMLLKTSGFWSTVLCVVLLSGQTPTARPAAQSPEQQKPNFSVLVDLVTTDTTVRDEKGNFVSDLTKDEFEIYEDGVKQEIASMTLSHGGRVTNVLAPPPAPAPEGIILPPVRRTNDVSGRIFLFFVDDLHLQFEGTPRVRELFKKISKMLVHDGDLFGIVSSGSSSISIDMTYDKARIDEAIKKMTGSELKPSEIINGSGGSGGPTEIRYRAHVAMSTMMEGLGNLEKVHNRRKALVWVSDGYDFIPFQAARLGLTDPRSGTLQNDNQLLQRQLVGQADGSAAAGAPSSTSPEALQKRQGEEFADADLARELGELTRAANRANTTIYTIDPRGLVGSPDLDEQVDPRQWNDFVRKSQDSLRALAEDTGGIAVVNQNDFDKALKRIDAETSDYYVLGYYSTNPDILKRRRQIQVRVTRKGVDVWSRKEYVLKPVPATSSQRK